MKPFLAHLRTFRLLQEMVLLVLLGGLLATAWALDPKFTAWASQRVLLSDMWELALLALPMTLIIITAGIDLSVGAAMGLCAVVLGLSYEAGISPLAGAALAIATGIAAGALNGWFVASVRVHPLIVTLATLAAYRGIAEGISRGRPLSGFPEWFFVIGRGTVAGVPVPGVLFLALTVAAAVFLAATPAGRALYAMGHNETAARFSGIAVDRLKLVLYTCSGAVAGLASVIYVARRNTAKASVGSGLELDVITAVVLGGTSIFGGRGTIVGTVLGVVLIHETRSFVSWRWGRDELIPIVIGALLVASVLVNRIVERGRSR